MKKIIYTLNEKYKEELKEGISLIEFIILEYIYIKGIYFNSLKYMEGVYEC